MSAGEPRPKRLLLERMTYTANTRGAVARKTSRGEPTLLAEVIERFIARFPFDITAQTWLLSWIDGLICQHCLDGRSQVLSRHRNRLAGPTLVQLPSIDQFSLPIKQEKVRGASCYIGFSYCQGFVLTVGEGEAFCHLFEAVGHIISIDVGIIGAHRPIPMSLP